MSAILQQTWTQSNWNFYRESWSSQETHLLCWRLFQKIHGETSSHTVKPVKREFQKIPWKSNCISLQKHVDLKVCWGHVSLIQLKLIKKAEISIAVVSFNPYYPQQKCVLFFNPLQPVLSCDSEIYCCALPLQVTIKKKEGVTQCREHSG